MLSRIKAFILGVISEQPMSAYEITKYVKELNLRRWFSISDSTIYNATRTLQQQGYIEGEAAKEGNMPEKTIYSITDSGKQAFKKTLEAVLVKPDSDYITLNLMLLFFYQLSKEELIVLFQKRLQALTKHQEAVLKLNQGMEDAGFPRIVLIAHSRCMRITEMDIRIVQEFIDALHSDGIDEDMQKRPLQIGHALLGCPPES